MTSTLERSVLIGSLLAVLTAGTVFARPEPLKAGEETQLHIPKMEAPTLDGRISRDEWGDAAALGGPAEIGKGSLDSRPATFYLGWDEKHIYMAVRVWMPKGYKPRIRGGRAQGFAECFDDGLEMVVRPMGRNVSNENHRTDFKFNISCLGFGGTYTRLVVGQLMTNWEPDFQTAVRVTADGTAPQGGRWWEMEVAFSLEDFELTGDNRAGDQWRMMLGVNHLPKVGWMQQRIPAVGGHFTADGKTLITLVDKAPVARLTMDSVPNLASDGTAALKLAVSNHSRATKRIAVDIDVAGTVAKTETLAVRAAGTRELVLDSKLPDNVKDGVITISAKDGAETILFYKSFFMVGRYNKRLVPPPPPDPSKFPLQVRFNPVRKLLHIKADSYNLPEPDAVKHLEYEIASKDSGRRLQKGVLATPRTWYYERVLALPKIERGEYTLTARFVLEDGTAFGPRTGSYRKLDEAEEFSAWWGADPGVSERVIAPYVAIEEQYGNVTCLDRSYRLNALGLPASVTSRGEAVLAAPARVVVVRDGRESVVEVTAAPQTTDRQDWRVRFKGTANGGGLAFSAEGWMEQDGMVSVRLTYGPEGRAPARIDALRIEYPVAGTVAECLLSVGPGANFAAITATVLPADKQGPLWSVFDTGRAGARMKVGSFYPHVWLGNEERGLQWWADSGRGWVPHDEVPAHEVYRTGDVVVLRNNIVGRPVELTEARTLRFTWTATPFKRLPTGWRNFAATENGTFFQPFHGKPFTDPASGEKISHQQARNWIHPNSRAPEHWDQEWAVWKKKADDHVRRRWPYDLYASRSGVNHTHKSFQLVGYGTETGMKNELQYFGAEWHAKGETHNPTFCDHLMWLFDQAFSKGGLRSTYWDLAFPILYEDPISGLGYELPDGRWQPGYAVLNYRRFFQRLWALQDKHGLNPGAVGTHSTNAYIFPALPWIDAVLDGERDWNLDTSDRDWVDYYPKERMRSMSVPHNWGVGICWMGNFHSADKAKLYEHKTRQVEYVWVHDSWINPYCKEARHLPFMPQPILDWGMNGANVSYEPYWRKQYADSGDDDVLVSVWRIPDEGAGRVLVGVFNYDRKQAKDVSVRLDLVKLGFSGRPLIMNDLSLDYTRGCLKEARARNDRNRVPGLERGLPGLGAAATFDAGKGMLTIKGLGAHRGRFIGVGAVDTDALATVKTQLPAWLDGKVPQKARDFGIAHWRTRHLPEGTTMAATCKNKAIKLGMWKREDRIILSVYNGGDQATDAVVSLNMDYLRLNKRLLWQEFVRAINLYGDGRQAFDYYGGKLTVKGIKSKTGRLIGIRRY